MIDDDSVLHDVAGAIVDGSAIDWPSAESNAAHESVREFLRELKVIARIADVHGGGFRSAERSAIGVPEVDGSDEAREGGPDSGAPQTWSVFRLVEKIGEGAFGEVYRARDTRLDREVALKLLRRKDSLPSRVASSAIDEGRMLAQVRHPNVVTVYGADRSDGRVGLWMEFIHGRTLEQVLREEGPLQAAAATLIARDLCRALLAVHRAGLLHRDIKAHNVMREDGGRIVLMDFGTGVDRTDDAADSARGLAGTPLYIAPEILDGQPATVRSDLYSVGVLLYHLVTGSYPVQGRSVSDVRDAQAARRPDPVARRSTRSGRGLRRNRGALAPSPEERYASADAMEEALAAITVSDPSGGTGSRTLPAWRRLAIAAMLVVMAAAGVRWLTVARSDPPVIAVLPFKNLSVERDSDYFVDGLTDEVIRNLSVIDGLAVRSSTSSFTFKNKPRNTREVGRQLNANLVLEASVLRAGTRLRINAQLVRAADDVPLWSARYDRELKDVFAIQDEISRSIVNELRLTLGRGQRRYNTNIEAYDLYLKARGLQAWRGPATRQAIDLFEGVIAKDPAFAPAYAARASAYGWSSSYRFRACVACRWPSIERMRSFEKMRSRR